MTGNSAYQVTSEAALLLGVPDLRAHVRATFFDAHRAQYTKSRRTAPIYLPIGTLNGEYAIWLYLPRVGVDTLFTLQSEIVSGKLRLEEQRLGELSHNDEGGAAARKAATKQQAFVDELREFLDEVKRVAPLWKPNLDDGVIINFAPLWRLVPQHKAWQKELKATWDALCEGEYDWAHLAMHLWPERVVPKCATDRSFAIAHGLEAVFWVEGSDGKWTARKAPTRPVEELVEARTSPAVKAALKSLLEAPVAAGGAKKARKGKKHA